MIEKFDKLRFNLVKWFTAGWAIWFGAFILKDLINNNLILGFIILIGAVGWVLFTLNFLKFMKLGKIINADSKLKYALNDELAKHYRDKSYTVGFWSFTIVLIFFIALSLFIHISSLLVCEITFYFGTLSALISSLMFNRN
jgi:hypothetical protein